MRSFLENLDNNGKAQTFCLLPSNSIMLQVENNTILSIRTTNYLVFWREGRVKRRFENMERARTTDFLLGHRTLTP